MNRRAFMAALMGSAVAPKMPSAKWIGMDRSRRAQVCRDHLDRSNFASVTQHYD